MDAKKNSFFAALYRRGERIGEYLDIDTERLIGLIKEAEPSPSLLMTGPAAPLAFHALAAAFPQSVVDPDFERSHQKELLNLANKKFILNKAYLSCSEKELFSPDSGPLYLRKSDAELHRQSGY
jgi:tRNA threonylcarbamoyladenosine biosynthesis protein TsaB